MSGCFGSGLRAAALVAVALVAAGCSSISIPFSSSEPDIEAETELVAVMPVVHSAPPAGESGGDVEAEAEIVVTAAIYGALSSTYAWRFVPDLTVADAMQGISPLDSEARRAQALGKAVEADVVIFGSVWRYVERVGTPTDAESPASVALTLRLLSVPSGEVLWEESYDKTQETLGATFFDWVLFWEDPPHWMSASELTHIGVDRMIEELRRRLD